MRRQHLIFVMMLIISLATMQTALGIDVAVTIDDAGEITQIQPYTPSEYYQIAGYYGASTDFYNTEEIPVTLSSDTETIYPRFHDTESLIFQNIDPSKRYVLSVEGDEHPMYFCNNNNRCEPCESGSCGIVENALTCPNDCATGSDDHYCDLALDGVCDPDCTEYDFDCESCVGSKCTYEGMVKPKTECDTLGGIACSVLQECDGTLIYTDDAGAFCCLGSCYDRSTGELGVASNDATPTTAEELAAQIAENNEAYVSEDDAIAETTRSFDTRIFIYALILVVILLASVIGVVLAESKAIKKEHQVRNYVYDLIKQGYSIEQIVLALRQQQIEEGLIKKIMRQYRR